MCVYEQGPNLVQVFGPPYSGTAFFKFQVAEEREIETHSERQFGTAIWIHQIINRGKPDGKITDFVDSEIPCLVRHFQLTESLHFRLTLEEPVRVVENKMDLPGCDGALLMEIPAGRYFYHVYPFPTVVYHQIFWQGSVQISPLADQSGWEITCDPGECTLFFCGGPDYPQVKTFSEKVLGTPYETLLERTRNYWLAYTRSQRDFNSTLPKTLPLRERLLQTIDDVAVLIKAQQSVEGGILAGYAYHMAYVRDQYGTTRGLITLGHIQEARAVLSFYWDLWQRYGVIHNGQAAGLMGIFHIHENDETELTGFLILQAFDLLAVSGDITFFEHIFPMLEWAWHSQVKNLVNGMLPFNGDETYIAGGMLPRSTINDGSAEATLLFITGGEKFLEWIAVHSRWPAEIIADNFRILERVKAAYRSNFFPHGRLITNNPERAKAALLPRFRHGVCEKCHEKNRWFIVWTERSPSGRYLCPECMAEGSYPSAQPVTYTLQSVSLAPFYQGSNLFEGWELAPAVNELAQHFHTTGRLPTRLDDEKTDGSAYSVGYDYGYLLNALAILSHPQAIDLYRQIMALLDPTGAWVEYYLDNQPKGTRCRPWESAINLEAILKWAIRDGTNPKF
jgi:hypothetical protein